VVFDYEGRRAWVEAQPLPTHVKSVLLNHGIGSLAQAYAVTPAQWKVMRNLGKKGYALVQQWLRAMDPERYLREDEAAIMRWYYPFDMAA
jgi:hypothetical protein